MAEPRTRLTRSAVDWGMRALALERMSVSRVAAALGELLAVRADGSTIRAIMRDLGLQAAGPRAKVRTTVPAQDLDERPDLPRRDSRR